MMRRLGLSLLLATMSLLLGSRSSHAICADSSLDAALITETVTSSALSPSAPHPILGRTIVAAGNQIFVRELGNLAAVGTPLTLTATVENTPNPVRMDDGSYGAFVVQQDGVVARISPEGSSPSLVWRADLRRSGCAEDSLSAAPLIQVRRYSSASFQARYASDVVFVATRYDRDCNSGNTANRIYALDANTGAALWEFNGDASHSLDVAHESPYLDYDEDRLVLGTDRSASAAQHTLWSIDVLTGSKAWSTNVGPMYASPMVRGNRIYVATLSGEIKALSKSDGATLWSVSNGGVPITTSIFREFRSPYGELIAAVDYSGAVWMVRDDVNYGSSVWTANLVDPATGLSAQATSRVAMDPSSGKLYVGANDGQIYQLNIVDGSVEATRMVSSGSAVGGASFVFEGADLNMIAGAASGVLAKFCGPWSAEASMSPLTPNCTSDAQCDPDNPNPTPCSAWTCQSGVCVVSTSSDGQSCTSDGNANTFGDECNAGICLGYSDCQQEPDACTCSEANGQSVTRSLQVSQTSCATAPPSGSGIDPNSWCGQEVSAVVAQSDCLAHGSGAQTAVWVHLFDENRRPFEITPASGSVSMTLSGGSGTPPVFLSPATFAPLAGSSASLSAGTVVASPNRIGTYYAFLGAQDASATPSGNTPWNVQVSVTHANGTSCVDTVANAQMLSAAITMGHVESQLCPTGDGYLRVQVSESTGGTHDLAPVQIGYASDTFLAQTFEESIRSAPTGAMTKLSNAAGYAEFIDFGHYLNGPVPVSATCPGGTIGDADTVTVQANGPVVDIALHCNATPAPGYVTYMVGGDIYRIEAFLGAVAVNLSTLLDGLGSGGDGYPAVSRNGEWMTTSTTRFGCDGWDCTVIYNSDFSAYEIPMPAGFGELHPEGRTAISNDGNTLLYFDDGPHQQDLYVTRKSGGSWSALTLLTAASPHEYNNQAVFSYDETKVLFDCGPVPYGQEGTGICEVDIDGTGFQQLIDPADNPFGGGTDLLARHADYAPDGSIVFEATWASEQLWRLTSPGAAPTQVIANHSNDNSPCVLPNGNIASLWLVNSPHEIKITAADGSSHAIITPGIDVADVGMSCHD